MIVISYLSSKTIVTFLINHLRQYQVRLTLYWNIITYKTIKCFSNMFIRFKPFAVIEFLTHEKMFPTKMYNK